MMPAVASALGQAAQRCSGAAAASRLQRALFSASAGEDYSLAMAKAAEVATECASAPLPPGEGGVTFGVPLETFKRKVRARGAARAAAAPPSLPLRRRCRPPSARRPLRAWLLLQLASSCLFVAQRGARSPDKQCNAAQPQPHRATALLRKAAARQAAEHPLTRYEHSPPAPRLL